MRFAAAILVFGFSLPAAAQGVYFSRDALLKEFFASSKRVTYEKLDVAQNASELKRRLGYQPSKKSYTVFVGMTGDKIDGYALIDDEKGQHLPITFGTKISADGVVERTEVMVYREGYGHEIREDRFRKQFSNKTEADPIRYGDDVVAISGATISARSMSIAVRRAVAVVAVLRRGKKPEIAATP